MFENFRERLHTVQQDFSTGIKTLSIKPKEPKVKKRRDDSRPQFSAGGEILNRYEDMWVALHKGVSECAKAGEAVDGDVVVLLAHWEKRRAVLTGLQDQLREVPSFLSDLGSITSRIAHMEADCEEMESLLMHLENLCGQCELQRAKNYQDVQLENYKKKKRKDLEYLKAGPVSGTFQLLLARLHCQRLHNVVSRQAALHRALRAEDERRAGSAVDRPEFHRASSLRSAPPPVSAGMSSPGSADGNKKDSLELDSEHAQKVLEMEHAQQVKLKERQKFFEEAFQQDMEQYLSTGYLQIAERREPIGSMSSMEVNVDMLEQMDLMDMSDHEALDVFLNSGGDDNSVASPMLGPDSESFPAEITLRVPTQAELRQKLSSLSPAGPETQGGEEAGGSPLVQRDEEEVHPETDLPEGGPPKDSDDSDSPAS
ncbi:hypothetical protein COCON_G00127390 [Conger conger]|uniref:Dystrobrevin binding protein 1 n=1 Tax=Conger conger TaxID=82655 RepID=A0A9Q1HWX6_CONCO|nr:hypothetical protein COCON_G00127390 [Conger conger]